MPEDSAMNPLNFSNFHHSAGATLRRRSAPLATFAVLALLGLPVVTGCSQESSSSASPAASATDAVVARVNGVAIRESDLAMAEDDLGSELQSVAPDVKREHLITYVADILLVAKAAEDRKLHEGSDFRQRQAFLRSKLLMGLLLQTQARTAATDEALQQVYNEKVKPMGAAEEVRARHILFRADPKDAKALAEAETKARAVLERIKAGEDFAKVAMELTEDPSGKQNGGDLGYFPKDQMVPEFANVAFQMYPGQVSNPVKTPFGWHIIKLEDKRNRPVPEFDQVKEQIVAFVVRRAQSELVAQLREKAKIERLDGKGAVIPEKKK
jgi:peptidyl-prolyl cis-trans isomerase C